MSLNSFSVQSEASDAWALGPLFQSTLAYLGDFGLGGRALKHDCPVVFLVVGRVIVPKRD